MPRYLWKIPFINRIIFKIPNLNGEWEGVYVRNEDEERYSLKLKITQSLSKIIISSSSVNSTGKSISIEMVKNEYNDVNLVYAWESKHNSLIHPDTIEHMYGLSLLRIENSDTLSGTYFTNRTPQTKGKCTFKRI